MHDGATHEGASDPFSRPSPDGEARALPPGERAAPAGAAPGGGVDAEEVRRLYELSDTPVSAIRKRFGLSPYAFRVMRERGGWTARQPAAQPGPLAWTRPVGARMIEYRMNRLVTVGLTMLEQRVDEEGMTETNARTLAELARAQEIMMRSKRNEKAAKAREKKSKDVERNFRADPAWARAELKRRIRQIRAAAGLGEPGRPGAG